MQTVLSIAQKYLTVSKILNLCVDSRFSDNQWIVKLNREKLITTKRNPKWQQVTSISIFRIMSSWSHVPITRLTRLLSIGKQIVKLRTSNFFSERDSTFRLPNHLIKCRRSHGANGTKECRFDSSHIVKEADIKVSDPQHRHSLDDLTLDLHFRITKRTAQAVSPWNSTWHRALRRLKSASIA